LPRKNKRQKKPPNRLSGRGKRPKLRESKLSSSKRLNLNMKERWLLSVLKMKNDWLNRRERKQRGQLLLSVNRKRGKLKQRLRRKLRLFDRKP